MQGILYLAAAVWVQDPWTFLRLAFLGYLGIGLRSWAQTVEIESADELGGTPERRILRGNVQLRQDTIRLRCQEAEITERGDFTARGGVITYIGRAGQIQAAQLTYDPETQRLSYQGNVYASFPPAQLRAPRLHYDRLTQTAWYEGGGVFSDTTGEIHSERGSYDTRTEVATFSGRVRIFRQSAQARTDSLVYESWRSYAIFPVGVIAWDTVRRDTLLARRAEWDRRTGEVFLRDSAHYRDTSFMLWATQAYYHPEQDSGQAFCDVRYRERKKRYFAWADTAYWIRQSLILRTNAALFLTDTTDTTFIQAERIWTQRETLYAAGDAELIRFPYRSRSDTLLYDTLHQSAHLRGQAWLTDATMQLYSRKITLHFRQRKPLSAHASEGVRFLTEADTFLRFYHQVVGDSAAALWDSTGTLREIYFIGRVQLLYYQSEGRRWKGAHHAYAERLYIQLDSLQQPAYARLEEKPRGTFYNIAPHIEAPLWLKGVHWMPPEKQPQYPIAQPKAPHRGTRPDE